MRYVMIILLCLTALAMPTLASAQVSCTEAELEAVEEALAEDFALFLELGELSEDLSMETYGELAVAYEALSFAHWTEVMPEIPACAEAQTAGFVYGSIYDEALNVVLLRWHALYEAENGSESNATLFASAAEVRNEELTELIEDIETVTELFSQVALGDLPCTEEQVAAYDSLSSEYITYYEIFGGDLITPDPDLNATYMQIYESSETVFSDRYGEILCSDTFFHALGVSSIYSDSLTVVMLMRTSVIESTMGNADVAKVLLDQAFARAEILKETLANVIGE